MEEMDTQAPMPQVLSLARCQMNCLLEEVVKSTVPAHQMTQDHLLRLLEIWQKAERLRKLTISLIPLNQQFLTLPYVNHRIPVPNWVDDAKAILDSSVAIDQLWVVAQLLFRGDYMDNREPRERESWEDFYKGCTATQQKALTVADLIKGALPKVIRLSRGGATKAYQTEMELARLKSDLNQLQQLVTEMEREESVPKS